MYNTNRAKLGLQRKLTIYFISILLRNYKVAHYIFMELHVVYFKDHNNFY